MQECPFFDVSPPIDSFRYAARSKCGRSTAIELPTAGRALHYNDYFYGEQRHTARRCQNGVFRYRMASKVRVLIADDHPLLATGVSAALGTHGIETVATVTRLEDLLTTYERKRPDVVILDTRFSPEEPSGIEGARDLIARHPNARVVFYTQFDEDQIIDEAYRAGGKVFVLKDSTATQLAAAVTHAAANTAPFFPPNVAARLALMRVRGEEAPQARLDPREYAVFAMLAYGFNNQQISQRLALSTKTIASIVTDVKNKLGLESPADLHAMAMKYHVDRPPSE